LITRGAAPRWHQLHGGPVRIAPLNRASLEGETSDHFIAQRLGSSLKSSGLIFDSIDDGSGNLANESFDKLPSQGSDLAPLNVVEACWKVLERLKSSCSTILSFLAWTIVGGAYADVLNGMRSKPAPPRATTSSIPPNALRLAARASPPTKIPQPSGILSFCTSRSAGKRILCDSK
jgi:hypothetical protein